MQPRRLAQGLKLFILLLPLPGILWDYNSFLPHPSETHFNNILSSVVKALCYKPEGCGFQTR
jgi:hypothetical protein